MSAAFMVRHDLVELSESLEGPSASASGNSRETMSPKITFTVEGDNKSGFRLGLPGVSSPLDDDKKGADGVTTR